MKEGKKIQLQKIVKKEIFFGTYTTFFLTKNYLFLFLKSNFYTNYIPMYVMKSSIRTWCSTSPQDTLLI